VTQQLSFLDHRHRPRHTGPLPDMGAYEFDALSGDDFESGDTYWW
jgi:hypothetical protein